MRKHFVDLLITLQAESLCTDNLLKLNIPMRRLVLTFLLALTLGSSAKAQTVAPAPEMEFVMQLKVTLDAPYVVGDTPHGRRTVIPITGGTFEGPLLKGTILNGGADWQLAKGNRTELEAIYSIKTDDGVFIHIRNRGIISSGKNPDGTPSFYFKCAPTFEAPEDSKYAWLNNALFLCAPSFGGDFKGIVLSVWKVK